MRARKGVRLQTRVRVSAHREARQALVAHLARARVHAHARALLAAPAAHMHTCAHPHIRPRSCERVHTRAHALTNTRVLRVVGLGWLYPSARARARPPALRTRTHLRTSCTSVMKCGASMSMSASTTSTCVALSTLRTGAMSRHRKYLRSIAESRYAAAGLGSVSTRHSRALL